MAKKNYIPRELEKNLMSAAKEFAAVAILGPRQSGKTTLARHKFPKHKYISLEDYDLRELANTDPRGFLNDYPSGTGIILDEIQHAPKLLSYIQTAIDLTLNTELKPKTKRGFFIITGSQNFLLNQAISQTLAGRVAILTLLPLSIAELTKSKLLPSKIETAVFTGAYPALYIEKRSITRLYQGYINTYLERDVRQIKNIPDLNLFKKFLSLCAGRIGQEVNYSSLGNDCGLDDKTIKAWLSVLEASYIIFLLQPYYKNFGKRLIKSPKLYFVDTGLACTLLRIKSATELLDSAMRGPLIENFIISDLLKQQYNLELLPSIYFWRDLSGNEIDCIIDEGNIIVPIEIKSSKTVIDSFFKNYDYWQTLTAAPSPSATIPSRPDIAIPSTPAIKKLSKISKTKTKNNFYVIYSGDENQNWPNGKALSWSKIGNLVQTIIN